MTLNVDFEQSVKVYILISTYQFRDSVPISGCQFLLPPANFLTLDCANQLSFIDFSFWCQIGKIPNNLKHLWS